MKQLYPFVLLLITSSPGSMAQSLMGMNATIWNTGDGTTYVNAFVDIHNISNSTVAVLVERKSQVLVQGHESNFCWGTQCYPPFVSLSPTPEPIAPNTVNTSFKGQLNPYGIGGLSRVTYCFFNQANSYDSVCFEFFYDIVLGLNENMAPADYLSAPSPNPANTMTAFSYRISNPNEAVKMFISDMTGKRIQTIPLNNQSGNFILNTSSLNQGIYFCSLVNGDKTVKTVRLSVVR